MFFSAFLINNDKIRSRTNQKHYSVQKKYVAEVSTF